MTCEVAQREIDAENWLFSRYASHLFEAKLFQRLPTEKPNFKQAEALLPQLNKTERKIAGMLAQGFDIILDRKLSSGVIQDAEPSLTRVDSIELIMKDGDMGGAISLLLTGLCSSDFEEYRVLFNKICKQLKIKIPRVTPLAAYAKRHARNQIRNFL